MNQVPYLVQYYSCAEQVPTERNAMQIHYFYATHKRKHKKGNASWQHEINKKKQTVE